MEICQSEMWEPWIMCICTRAKHTEISRSYWQKIFKFMDILHFATYVTS